ncbi:unnamed protein product [Blepharisma stoltei]|uniref:RING-type domain-containing protein n=1 Tax=Blepharisma stoltei TaxID=1481888 RepID=A0AAU9IX78_9CILI|nr:unnamed protein product [Blepharisma stoltei]
MDIEDLCCGICQQNFDSTQREPRMLQCGHSFCSLCLQELFGRGIKSCPEDSTAFNVSSVEELPKNFALLKFLTKTVPKVDNKLCINHKKILEYICIQDKVKVCASCALFGQHRGHEIKPLDDMVQEITMRAELLLDMLQIIEKSQSSVMDKDVKIRLEQVFDLYKNKKIFIEKEIKDGFARLRSNINELEKAAVSTMQKNFEYIESNIVNIRDIPKLIDSQTIAWKDRVKEKLGKFTRQTEDPTYVALDILDNSGEDLFQQGEKLIVDLEGLKDIQIEPLEETVNELSVQFSDSQLVNICKVKPSGRSPSTPRSEKKHPSKPEEFKSIDEEDLDGDLIPQFNEEMFNQALDVLKYNTSEIADFSNAGDLGDKAAIIATYLVNNTNLKSLKLVKNSISDSAAIEIFRALQENFSLQSLHLSQNPLGTEALDELIEMLNVNTTLRDIYLIGNQKMSPEYKSNFAQMSSRFRKIYT